MDFVNVFETAILVYVINMVCNQVFFVIKFWHLSMFVDIYKIFLSSINFHDL